MRCWRSQEKMQLRHKMTREIIRNAADAGASFRSSLRSPQPNPCRREESANPRGSSTTEAARLIAKRLGRSGLGLEQVASPSRKSVNAQIKETCPPLCAAHPNLLSNAVACAPAKSKRYLSGFLSHILHYLSVSSKANTKNRWTRIS